MKKTTVKVYDTFTKTYVDIEVAEKVAKEFNRTKWNIEKNDKSFFEHQIQFSMLKGGQEGAFENFHEFVVHENITEQNVMEKYSAEKLYSSLAFLPESDYELIHMLFFKNMTERECAERFGINQKNINKKKHRILAKLHKLLEN